MSTLEISQAYHCVGKKVFTTRVKAVYVAEEIRLKNVRDKYVDPRGEMEPYKCSNCGLWHLGHPVKEYAK